MKTAENMTPFPLKTQPWYWNSKKLPPSLFLVTMTWFRNKRSIQLSLSPWKPQRIMSSPINTTEQWPANVSGWQLSWDTMSCSSVVTNSCTASDVLSSRADMHLLRENQLGLPAPFLFGSKTLYSPLYHLQLGVVSRLYRVIAHAHTRCSFCMQFPSLPPLSGEHLLTLFSGPLRSSSIKWQI